MTVDKVTYWIDLADYDLDTSETLYKGGRWLYVAFMCHQKDPEGILVWNTIQ